MDPLIDLRDMEKLESTLVVVIYRTSCDQHYLPDTSSDYFFFAIGSKGSKELKGYLHRMVRIASMVLKFEQSVNGPNPVRGLTSIRRGRPSWYSASIGPKPLNPFKGVPLRGAGSFGSSYLAGESGLKSFGLKKPGSKIPGSDLMTVGL